MSPTDPPAAEFGPAVIYDALLSAGVRFHFIGFVTHYAAELCGEKSAERNPARSHEDNVERLARALVTLDARTRTVEGHLAPFTGDSAALHDIHQWFETPHGKVMAGVRVPGEAIPGRDSIVAGVRICIDTSVEVLRAHAATGRFPGLDYIVEIVELFESAGAGKPAEDRP